jgi:hypothetical protein
MTRVQKDLLADLFIKNSTQAIETNKQEDLKFLMQCDTHEELLKNIEYTRYYQLLQKQKKKIEDIAKDKDLVNQVRKTVFLLYYQKEQDSAEVFDISLQFVTKCLLPGWPEPLKNKFGMAQKYFLKGVHFFVSYTTRNSFETNKDYKSLITDLYDDLFYESNKKNNLVASVIAKYLMSQGLNTFFDKDILQNGDMLEEAIDGYCSGSFAFIQFVELVMFRQIKEGDKNWTFHEYCQYKSHIEELVKSLNDQIKPNFYFVLSDPDGNGPFPVGFPDPYDGWRADIDYRIMDTITRTVTKAEIRTKIRMWSERIFKKREKALSLFIQSIN